MFVKENPDRKKKKNQVNNIAVKLNGAGVILLNIRNYVNVEIL